MYIEIIKEKLQFAVSKAEKITGKNLTLPVLNNLLLKTDNGILKVIATNLDLGIEINVSVNIKEEGEVVVPGGLLNSLISSDFKSSKITLETKENNNLHFLSDNNSTLIKTQPNEDFPSIPRLKDANSFTINSKKLIKGLKSVWYSSSTSNIKPELSSVLIYPDGSNIVFVATDSFRLAEKKVVLDSPVEFEQILIPFKNIPEIMRIFDDVDDDIKIYLIKNQIAFEYDNIYLTSRVIDGNFPDYQQLIPKEFTTEITLLKDDFMNSLKVSNLFSDKFNKITLSIKTEKKVFEIVSKNKDVGENITKVDCVLSGDDVEISFNQKYIMDCFQSINSDSLVLRFNGLNKPLVIKSTPDTGFTYLVMPMNK